MTQSLTPQITPEITNRKPSPDDFEKPAIPDLTNVIIDDGEPVDNLISEKQQRLLVSSLYSSFNADQPFLATANVGLFYAANKPPLVPDIMLSLEVTLPEDWSEKKDQSYFTWNFGKSPEIVIEIVSNKVGNELGTKLKDYSQARVGYYVVFDPFYYLGKQNLYIYQLIGVNYQLLSTNWLEGVGLGLTVWEGEFEGKNYQWLRGCDEKGQLLLIGDEKVAIEKQRANEEKQRADQERKRVEYLEEILRSQGINF
ncbi:Uma2 family endonuclease [Sphaerospermopsis torques-reginae]|uniref:Uma2 family endonuclease n=1 Tax=Sphaerospermopsis torques-reginae ITEP-024 TaxID=984208 RepID=A0ABX8WY90_9CYAN|nr:Uma2 family endonuclease [Sphaerospermopsis torques-reginae]QYX31392.1 Uma2 family endonuclease [Sphaerospermopsis torques-reginae ITEP-024]